ncbi:hypothetical protein HPB52_020059 [Rhipicephalus sanguineus]|uniref:Uncharacterized protein n=1 Tax=Rhipicephalus sanguineus TaxID=34632 RepID=A0A9D4QBW9_RHISA|nr:hypothetical protein HPB52_020059 [Rhipicephalus sanguineus]
MAATQQLRPLTFYGRVPKGTTNVDICKELVKRFSPNELKCVQDFGAGRFEVTFATMAAVERFLDQSVVKVRNAEVKFEYRGVRVKTVRVLGYPADASAFFPGHHAADCKVPQCERCAEFGHARCEAVCKRCGDDHALSACKVTSGAAEGQEAPSKGPEGSPLPETEPVRAEAPGGGEQGTRPELAEASDPSAALPPPAASTDVPAAPADVPADPADAPAAEEDQGETMDAEPWRLVRGKRRRARSSDSSDERPAAAACGGPGDLEEGLPGVKRTAATDSDSESTQSTVKGSTEGETSLFSSSCPYCGLGTCDGDCSPLSDRVYSSTHEDSSSDEESSQ